ncbi:MAG: hypothetical protein WC444_05075 [Candidatus Paceibacterota bacterium]
MSRKELLDDRFVRWEVVVCDKCGAEWTVDVAEKRGWDLDNNGRDFCNYCAVAKKKKNVKY